MMVPGVLLTPVYYCARSSFAYNQYSRSRRQLQLFMPMPADLLVVGVGRLPDETEVTFYVRKAEIDDLRAHGPQEKLDNARFLEECMANPDAIFSGLRRPEQDESLCYSVRPTRDQDETPVSTDSMPRYGFAFLAFVRVANMGYVIFDWEWRQEDPDHPGRPIHWQQRFPEECVWPRN